MKVLCPRSKYLCGVLINAIHVSEVFKVQMYVFEKSPHLQYQEVIPMNSSTIEELISDEDLNVLDIFDDGGYYNESIELVEFLLELTRSFHKKWGKRLPIHQHTAPGNFKNWWNEFFYSKFKDDLDKIKICQFRESFKGAMAGYRGSENLEFVTPNYVFSPSRGKGVLGLNEFYSDKDIDVLIISRASSNKLDLETAHSIIRVLENYGIKTHLVKGGMSYSQAIELYGRSKISISGVHYNGKGPREYSEAKNKLEWSVLDSIYNYCYPITTDLFSKELDRIGIDSYTIPYEKNSLDIVQQLDLVRFIQNTLMDSDLVSKVLSNYGSMSKHVLERL